MEMNENSLEVYKKISESGALSEMLLKALKAFYAIGRPCTAEEAHDKYNELTGKEPNQNLFNSYTTQLKKQCGALIVVDKKKNSNENTVDVYRVTGTAHKPIKPIPKSEKQLEIKKMLRLIGQHSNDRDIRRRCEEVWGKVLQL
jgi:hypothetical protein